MTIHRSLTFWAGVVVFTFLLWVRRDALVTETTLGLRDFPGFAIMIHPGGLSFFEAAIFRVGPATIQLVNTWDVFGYLDLDPVILTRNPAVYPQWIPQAAVFTIGHGTLFGLASIFIAIGLFLRRLRFARKEIMPGPAAR